MKTRSNKFTHAVYRTAFHGGGLVSRHHSEAAAIRAAAVKTDCTCGCLAVVALPAPDDMPYAEECTSPYQAAL